MERPVKPTKNRLVDYVDEDTYRDSTSTFHQDQHTDTIDLYLCQFLNTATLASDITINTRTATLEAGHNFVVGNIFCIKEDQTFYQGTVINVATNVITVDSPFDYGFTTAATLTRTSANMNVNGASTPVTFSVQPPTGATWDIARMLVVIRDDAAMDDAKFGGLTALANGCVFRRSNGTLHNLFNAKSNGDFALRAYDATYTEAVLPPSGQYGFRVRRSFNGNDKNGVVIRLDGDLSGQFQCIVQDDLSGLVSFRCVIQGHKTD